jgi:hypothetical protein
MADFLTKSCPRCGKRPLDLRLEECPYCGVPFELVPTNLTEEQLSAMTRHILRSGKFWSVVGGSLLAVALALAVLVHWENSRVSRAVADSTARQIAFATGNVSERISAEIAAEFQQPRIQAAIERVASQKAADAISNAVWPSLEVFRSEFKAAQTELARTKSDLASFSNDLSTARIAAGQILAAVSNEPPFLQLVDEVTNFNGSNFVLTLAFRPSNANSGPVELAAGTWRQTSRIISFTARNVDHVDPPAINDFGDAAVLKFTTGRTGAPILVDMELTDGTILRIMSDSLEQALTLPMHPELMRVPQVTR